MQKADKATLFGPSTISPLPSSSPLSLSMRLPQILHLVLPTKKRKEMLASPRFEDSPSVNTVPTPTTSQISTPPNLSLKQAAKERAETDSDEEDETTNISNNDTQSLKHKLAQSKLKNHSNSTKKKRRLQYTTEQIGYLEQVYSTDSMPCLQKRQELEKLLGRSARSVQIWFQNKRQKDKKVDQTTSSSTQNSSAVSASTSGIPTINTTQPSSLLGLSPIPPSLQPALSPLNVSSTTSTTSTVVTPPVSQHIHNHRGHRHSHSLPPPPLSLLNINTTTNNNNPLANQTLSYPSISQHQRVSLDTLQPLFSATSPISSLSNELCSPPTPSSIPHLISDLPQALVVNHKPLSLFVAGPQNSGSTQTYFCETHRQTLDYRLHGCGCITVQPIKKREYNQTVYYVKKLQIFDWNVQDSESMFEPSNGNLRIVVEKEPPLELSWEFNFGSSLRRISLSPADIKAIQVKTLNDSGLSALILQIFRPPRFGIISTLPMINNSAFFEDSNKSQDDFNTWNVVEDFTTDFIASKFNIHVLYLETPILLLFLERLKEPMKERFFKIMQDNLIEAPDTKPYFSYLSDNGLITRYKLVLPKLLSLESPKNFKQTPEEHECECGHLDEEHYENEGICNTLQCSCLFFQISTFTAFQIF